MHGEWEDSSPGRLDPRGGKEDARRRPVESQCAVAWLFTKWQWSDVQGATLFEQNIEKQVGVFARPWMINITGGGSRCWCYHINACTKRASFKIAPTGSWRLHPVDCIRLCLR